VWRGALAPPSRRSLEAARSWRERRAKTSDAHADDASAAQAASQA
jgi:hypothetical protein